MNAIKRVFMTAVGLVLIIGGARLIVIDTHWVLDLLLGGAMASGMGLVAKALLDSGEKNGRH